MILQVDFSGEFGVNVARLVNSYILKLSYCGLLFSLLSFNVIIVHPMKGLKQYSLHFVFTFVGKMLEAWNFWECCCCC